MPGLVGYVELVAWVGQTGQVEPQPSNLLNPFLSETVALLPKAVYQEGGDYGVGVVI